MFKKYHSHSRLQLFCAINFTLLDVFSRKWKGFNFGQIPQKHTSSEIHEYHLKNSYLFVSTFIKQFALLNLEPFSISLRNWLNIGFYWSFNNKHLDSWNTYQNFVQFNCEVLSMVYFCWDQYFQMKIFIKIVK